LNCVFLFNFIEKSVRTGRKGRQNRIIQHYKIITGFTGFCQAILNKYFLQNFFRFYKRLEFTLSGNKTFDAEIQI
jgi:hypothetical protein